MIASPIDLSHGARAARIDAYHRTFLTVPVDAVSPGPPLHPAGVETASSRAAGTTARETCCDEERTTVAPAAQHPGVSARFVPH